MGGFEITRESYLGERNNLRCGIDSADAALGSLGDAFRHGGSARELVLHQDDTVRETGDALVQHAAIMSESGGAWVNRFLNEDGKADSDRGRNASERS